MFPSPSTPSEKGGGFLRNVKCLAIVPFIKGTQEQDSKELDMLVATAAGTPSTCPVPSSPTGSQAGLPSELGGPSDAEPGSTFGGKEPGVGSLSQTKCAVKSCGLNIVKQPSRTGLD